MCAKAGTGNTANERTESSKLKKGPHKRWYNTLTYAASWAPSAS